MKIKILKSTYEDLRETALVSFAQDVLTRVKDPEAFPDLQPEVQPLESMLPSFAEAVARSRRGSPEDTLRKNQLKGQLLEQLDRLAERVVRTAEGDFEYAMRSGFPLAVRKPRPNGPLPTPRIVLAESTGAPGEIRLALQHEQSRRVLNYAVEYSTDRGATWLNGTYQTRTAFTLGGLPRLVELQVRSRAIGSNGQKSEWSQPATVAVA